MVAWLWIVAAMIAAMVLVGGITRLTGSGLSITEWRPVTGMLPPLGDRDWLELFEKYRASPQYQRENSHFDLAAFKSIFWWEWAHRFLGRTIGIVVIVPLLVFWRRRLLEPWLLRRCLLLVALGGFQGLLGWLMVKSGLVDQPRVSHYRLAAHLLTALLTLVITIWTVLQVRHGRHGPPGARVSGWITALSSLLVVQLVYGAFVAGLKAGYLFPTFPKMGDDWIPSRALYPGALASEALGNAVLVQLIHRWLGAAVALCAIFAAISLARRTLALRPHAWALAGAAALQFTLGALTILSFYRSPVLWGALHQAGAVLLVVAVVFAAFHERRAVAPAP